MAGALAYAAGAALVLWGTAHIVATNSATGTFGELSRDNRLVLRME